MGDDEEPTPALRDRVRSSQDFTFAPPLPGGDFWIAALTRKSQDYEGGIFSPQSLSCVALWMDCSTQFHVSFGCLKPCCQSGAVPSFDFCFDAEPFQGPDQAFRIRVFDLKTLKRTTLRRIL